MLDEFTGSDLFSGALKLKIPDVAGRSCHSDAGSEAKAGDACEEGTSADKVNM